MDNHNRRAAQGVGKPVRAVGWSKVSDYCITNGTHNICRVFINGVERFEVWQLNPRRMVSWHATAAAAKGAV
jgi:hypothetical protein